MNINILCYFLFGIAGGKEVGHAFVKFIALIVSIYRSFFFFNGCFFLKNIGKSCTGGF